MSENIIAAGSGTGGYLGSPAEKLDQAAGIRIGCRVWWNVEPEELLGTIIAVGQDEHGDPWFDLTFPDDGIDPHKDVRVGRDEIFPEAFKPSYTPALY